MKNSGVLNGMNFCLCQDAENQEGAIHVEALVDSDLQSPSGSVIEADGIVQADAPKLSKLDPSQWAAAGAEQHCTQSKVPLW